MMVVVLDMAVQTCRKRVDGAKRSSIGSHAGRLLLRVDHELLEKKNIGIYIKCI